MYLNLCKKSINVYEFYYCTLSFANACVPVVNNCYFCVSYKADVERSISIPNVMIFSDLEYLTDPTKLLHSNHWFETKVIYFH